jgi:hypothetical protein
MVIGVFLMLLGALGPIAAIQWRSGRWLDSARWIARNSSLHLLYAAPVAGILVACVGLSIIWPPGIVLVFLSAAAFMWALLASPLRRSAQASPQSEAAPAGRGQAALSGPFSSRSEIARRTDRPGTPRRSEPKRSRTGQTGARRDARRAG